MGNEKVLLIDSDKETCDFVGSVLKNEGYSVVDKSAGIPAIEFAREAFPKIIILEVGLPDIDGIEVCKELRAIKGCADSIIIFLTTHREDYTEIAAYDAGADLYILKPTRPRVFISRIRALCRRISSLKKYDAGGNLVVDISSQTVTINDKKVELSKKGFMLFELLASKPGKVFSRHDIHKLLWNNDMEVDERVIDVYIWKLREKLGKEIIKTVKGVGYKMVASM